MSDLINDPTIQAGLGVLVLCGLTAIAYWGVSKFRDYNAEDQDHTGELLANLKELHLSGEITDEEYRTINQVNQSCIAHSAGGEPEPPDSDSPQTTSPN